MIDKTTEIFNSLIPIVKAKYKDASVKFENASTISTFPTITVEETSNVPYYLDSSNINQYAFVRIRIMVFCTSGKRQMARDIFSMIDEYLQTLNVYCKSYIPDSNAMGKSIYQITGLFECVIDRNGCVYKSR